MKLSVKIPPSNSTAVMREEVEGEPLSPMAKLFCEPQFNYYIIYMMGFGNILSAEEIKAGLKATLLLHPRFSSIIQVTNNSWRKKLLWVSTEANLDEHVVFPDPGPAAAAAAVDPTVGDLYVENYASDLCHSGLDTSRPLWDLHILNIRTSEAAGVGVFRIHHSLGDGISLMSLLHACTRRTSDPESLPSLPETRRRSTATAARSGPLMFLCRIWTCLIYAWNTLVDLFFFISAIFFLKDGRTPFMEKEGVEYRPKRIAHRTLLLDDIKAITNTIGCTINDVLVGVTSAALSRYLSRCYGGLPPKHVRIKTYLAVNIRPISGIHNLTDMMKENSEVKWGNKIGFFLLRLPIMECEDPLDYVRKVTSITQKKKASFAAILSYKLCLWIDKIMSMKVAAILFLRILSNTTLCFSNIVGPIEEVGFCGSPLVYIAPTIYGTPQPMWIHVQSYLNKIKIVLAVDKHAIPDPHKLLDDIADSLQIIKDAATSKLKPE